MMQAMKPLEVREVAHLPAPLQLYATALLSVRKRNRQAMPMPAISLLRPELTLDAEHIARYAALCGFQAAHGVPLTYPHMLAFPLNMMLMADAKFPYSMMGMVHLANSIHQHAPLSMGQRIRMEVRFGAPLAHEKGQAFTLLTQVHDLQDETLLWESSSTYLRTGVHAPFGLPCHSQIAEVRATRAAAEWQVDANIGRRYAAISGDMNPIHLYAFAAKVFGFRRAIAHGMWTKARALAAVMPARPVVSGEVAVEFKTPLYLPGCATLWLDPYRQAGETAALMEDASGDCGQVFEVKDGRGEKPYLRGRWRT